MNTAEIQKQCEEFLKSIGVPGFVIIGLQTTPTDTQMVYSLKDMPLRGAIAGLSKVLGQLADKIK